MKKILKGADLEKKMGLGEQVAQKPIKQISASLGQHGGVISKIELSAQERGQKIIEEAEVQAGHIQAEAEKLYSQIKDEMEKSKAQGYQKGKEEGLSQLTEEILKVKKLKEEFIATAEPEVIKLVLSIAEKVIGKLVEEHQEAVRAIVRQALERSLGDRITVKINPEDLKRLQTEDLQFKDILDRTRHLYFKEDETIQKGGCVVETEVGTIDAQLETQLKAIRKALGV